MLYMKHAQYVFRGRPLVGHQLNTVLKPVELAKLPGCNAHFHNSSMAGESNDH